MARLTGVVPAIAAARHRDSLRGIIERALSLRVAVGERHRQALDGDLGQLIDLATVAASRLDELDTQLGESDLHSPDRALRKALRERDTWAARLHEVTAFLDAMRARYAALGAASPDGSVGSDDRDAEGALADLRAHIEALEEVEQL